MPSKADETAEVSIDDLGLNLDHLEQPGAPSGDGLSPLEETDHPADAPTMVAGLDERSRRMMEDAANHARDRDLTELERELEASFIADLDQQQESIESIPESERWNPVPGSAGRQHEELPNEDEDNEGLNESAQLVEEGVQEAEHDQMLQAEQAAKTSEKRDRQNR